MKHAVADRQILEIDGVAAPRLGDSSSKQVVLPAPDEPRHERIHLQRRFTIAVQSPLHDSPEAAVEQEDLLCVGVDTHRIDPVEVRRAAAASRERGHVDRNSESKIEHDHRSAFRLPHREEISVRPDVGSEMALDTANPGQRASRRRFPFRNRPEDLIPPLERFEHEGAFTVGRNRDAFGIVNPSLALPRDHRVHAPLFEKRTILEPMHRDPMVELVGDEEPIARNRQIDGRVEQSGECAPVSDRSDLLAGRADSNQAMAVGVREPGAAIGEAHDSTAPRIR